LPHGHVRVWGWGAHYEGPEPAPSGMRCGTARFERGACRL
jgi:hypothetical protein